MTGIDPPELAPDHRDGRPGRWAQTVEEVLSGTEKIVSHDGTSQYGGGGIASCGLAGLNFVRIVFARIEEGLDDGALLEDVLSRRTSEEVISICSRWPRAAHLEVEDIFKVPLFKRALSLVSSTYGEPGFTRFRAVLLDLQSIPNDYAAVLITRPPEIVTCFKLPVKTQSGNKQDVFIIFDSHPRPAHDGAGLIVNTSIDATASHLDNLLAIDAGLLGDKTLQWQAQLLANFSGHFFVPKGVAANSVEELTLAVLDSSLEVLSLQAEVTDLKFQTSGLERDRQTLERQLEELKDRYQYIKRKLDTRPRSCEACAHKPSPTSTKPAGKHRDLQPQPVSGPSRSPASSHSPPRNALEYFSSSANIIRSNASHESADFLVAKQLQMDINDRHRSSGSSYAQAVRSTSTDDDTADFMVAARLQMDWDQKQRDDALQAQAKQREYEDEDARLIAERATLQKEAQPVFECGICFDKFPEDYVARITDCAHGFCRECMKSYVVSKLTDKLYPIFCPLCVTDIARVEPATISDDLVQTLGLNDKEYQILQELQIISLSILLHCRKCKQSVFVDRGEYEAAPILVCPLPRCNYTWCKACHQTIPMDGPKHSCDGSSELEHLMKRRGWKQCPGCKTVIHKVSGCNHITCMAPGCNTHFCYVCGESIVRSALRREIQAAVSAHYSRCNLFEDVPDQ
ncbi:hypothetical protein B0H15DRAFT_836463 [Mycena belliarum]|uniref:RBR-type E3 ubiquitin transferase n=1 Tax=Mycena belliarum TaxID=1033014 RepID=A0AAD6XQA0_9AGAR|nr:hypothetical protein B0H15DRAFT_836463 [Mycena belliae]